MTVGREQSAPVRSQAGQLTRGFQSATLPAGSRSNSHTCSPQTTPTPRAGVDRGILIRPARRRRSGSPARRVHRARSNGRAPGPVPSGQPQPAPVRERATLAQTWASSSWTAPGTVRERVRPCGQRRNARPQQAADQLRAPRRASARSARQPGRRENVRRRVRARRRWSPMIDSSVQ